MAVSVKKITLWRGKIDDRPGSLARLLEPLAEAGADLQVVMGYREAERTYAVAELFPISGRKASDAVSSSGLAQAEVPSLLVVGDNRPGVAHAMGRALGDAGINLSFLVAQAVGKKYSAVLGFSSDADATRAMALVRGALAKRRR